MRKKHRVPVYRRNSEDNNQSKHVSAEEVEIHVEGEEEHQQPFNKHFRLHKTGCIGSVVGLVLAAFLIVIFLPLGIAALLATAGYLGWKFRRQIWRNR